MAARERGETPIERLYNDGLDTADLPSQGELPPRVAATALRTAVREHMTSATP